MQTRSARGRAGHALSVMGIVAHRTAVPAALLALVTLTLCALAAGLPATEGLVAAVPLIEPVGEWGSSVLRTAATAVGVLVALRILAIALAAAAWLVFPRGHRELLAELSRRADEVEDDQGR